MMRTIVFGVGIVLTFAASTASADSVGTVQWRQGPVEGGVGKLVFNELEPGGKVKTNAFSQYKGPENEKRHGQPWAAGVAPREIKEGESLTTEEVLHTGPLAWSRVLLRDESIIDLGPDTYFAIDRLEMNGRERHVRLRLLSGRARVLVVRKLEGRSTFYLSTPGVLVSVRGTDFAVHTDLSGDQALTHVLGIRGQVTCDLARNTKGGEVYHQQVVVNTYSLLRVESAEGYALSFNLEDKLAMGDYSRAMDAHAPLTDPVIAPLGRHPRVSELPGTGVPRTNRRQMAVEQLPAQGLAAELEAEHPPANLGGLARSGNFDPPQELEKDWGAVNQRLGPYTKALGPSAVDRLPYEAFRASTPGIAPPRP